MEAQHVLKGWMVMFHGGRFLSIPL